MQASTQQQLRQFIEQIERLEEERRATVADIRNKFAEAKAQGFDPKTMKRVIALRRKGKTEREEEEAVLATYMHALGMAAQLERPAVATDAVARWTAALEDADRRGASHMMMDHNVWSTADVRQVLTDMGAKFSENRTA